MTSPRIIMQLIAAFCILSLNVKSQNYSIEISTQINDDRSVDFLYLKKDYGTFYLNLTFNQLVNTLAISYKGGIYSLNGKILTIKPLDQTKSVSYSYQYTYIRGELNPKIDSGFVYLLPISKGKTLRVMELKNLQNTYFGTTQPQGWKAFQFLVQAGDTVFSTRKGIVVDVKDGNVADSTMSYSYSNKSNSILIEHEDGTLALYDVLKNGSQMVEVGQKVFPHAPLAIAGTYDINSNTQIRFYVYYLCERDLNHADKVSLITNKNFYAFVNPLFHTSDGDLHLKNLQNYTADFTTEHILKEMSKREKKKLGK